MIGKLYVDDVLYNEHIKNTILHLKRSFYVDVDEYTYTKLIKCILLGVFNVSYRENTFIVRNNPFN